ncbi:MAG: carboxypeptidase-like regulatory domain-containing protein [Methanotrichaceae archaeon]
MLIFLFIGTACSQGMGDSKEYDYLGTPVISSDQAQQQQAEDWINPYSAGTPEWDPYGPGSQPTLGRPDWDPYGPEYYQYASGSYSGGLRLQQADPSKEKLGVTGYVPYQNQLYLQRGPGLQSQGSVILGEPFVLWAHVIGAGGFTLYDRNQAILTHGYLMPGWYKIEGLFSDTLEAHQYQFASAGIFSNILTVAVGSGGYPTSYSLTGRVVDQYGNSIPDAKIIISSSEGGYFSTKTNAFGYYGMDVATGTYIITAEKSGYRFTQSTANVWTGVVSAARDIIGSPLSI